MYFRQMLRTPLYCITAARLLRPAFRVEVVYPSRNLLLFVTFNIVCLLAEAGHSVTCPGRRAGQVTVGNRQSPTSQPQVCLVAPHRAAGFGAGT